MSGRKIRHEVVYDDCPYITFVRYRGVPAQQLLIEGSFCLSDVAVVTRALNEWAEDPESFWEDEQ